MTFCYISNVVPYLIVWIIKNKKWKHEIHNLCFLYNSVWKIFCFYLLYFIIATSSKVIRVECDSCGWITPELPRFQLMLQTNVGHFLKILKNSMLSNSLNIWDSKNHWFQFFEKKSESKNHQVIFKTQCFSWRNW
jgi:hypothetical protein